MKFDYYIYIDYSENFIGYTIISRDEIKDILPKISKLHHYKQIKHKRQYIVSIKKRITKNKLISHILKYKITKLRYNSTIFADVLEFVSKHSNCGIFISVDNNQYAAFMKLFKVLPHKENIVIIRESKLKKNSMDYKLSLIIDTLLNIKRLKEQSK